MNYVAVRPGARRFAVIDAAKRVGHVAPTQALAEAVAKQLTVDTGRAHTVRTNH